MHKKSKVLFCLFTCSLCQQQGLLTGPAFTLIYSVASIPFARLADATSRVRVFLLGLILTGLMVLLTSLSTTYLMLVLARIGLGIGTVSLFLQLQFPTFMPQYSMLLLNSELIRMRGHL